MARNQFAGRCYLCGLTVKPYEGHFERCNLGWRVKHANVAGQGRVTCEMAKQRAEGENDVHR